MAIRNERLAENVAKKRAARTGVPTKVWLAKGKGYFTTNLTSGDAPPKNAKLVSVIEVT